jgi:hypothetical protein
MPSRQKKKPIVRSTTHVQLVQVRRSSVTKSAVANNLARNINRPILYEACQEAALKSCKNKRLDIPKKKEITATYKGQPIQSKTGKDDLCLDYPNRDTEFNQCPEALLSG